MISVSKISKKIGGKVEGNHDLLIEDICELKGGAKRCISYIGHEKYSNHFLDSKSYAVIADMDIALPKSNKTIIRVNNPILSFNTVAELFRPLPPRKNCIHSSAKIKSSAKIGKKVNISQNVVIDENVIIGDNVYVGPNTVIGYNSKIGNNSSILANVSIYHDISIGKNVYIDSGTVIGADGFGLFSERGIHHRIPHTGRVDIGDHVAIGSNCSIDRGTINSTIIGEHSKLDNLIQIAHNVVIGKGCIIAGQAGIAGSAILGNYVTIGGQSGIAGHIEIGNNSVIATNSLVTKSLIENSFVSGIPARKHLSWKKQQAIINQLPELLNRITLLERRLEEFKKD